MGRDWIDQNCLAHQHVNSNKANRKTLGLDLAADPGTMSKDESK
jgi:hypothetical protein